MREIKFRGLNINSEWKYGYLLADDIDTGRRLVRVMYPENVPPRYTDCWVDSDTVGQYTGLKDRNGKEIYEGDVLRVNNMDGEVPTVEYIGLVAFQSGCFGVMINKRIMESFDMIHNGTINYLIIGNIHEHPQLINQ